MRDKADVFQNWGSLTHKEAICAAKTRIVTGDVAGRKS